MSPRDGLKRSAQFDGQVTPSHAGEVAGTVAELVERRGCQHDLGRSCDFQRSAHTGRLDGRPVRAFDVVRDDGLGEPEPGREGDDLDPRFGGQPRLDGLGRGEGDCDEVASGRELRKGAMNEDIGLLVEVADALDEPEAKPVGDRTFRDAAGGERRHIKFPRKGVADEAVRLSRRRERLRDRVFA